MLSVDDYRLAELQAELAELRRVANGYQVALKNTRAGWRAECRRCHHGNSWARHAANLESKIAATLERIDVLYHELQELSSERADDDPTD